MDKLIRIQKTDHQQQTATGLVYEPLVVDSQGDFMTAEGVRAASERFMKSGRTQSVDVNHSGVPVSAFISESLISSGDDTFKDGAWVVTAKIEDPDLWASVVSGELAAFSMAGEGARTTTTLNGKAVKKISNLEVFSISLVKRGAHGASFSVLKSDDKNDALAELQKTMTELQATLSQLEGKVTKAVAAGDHDEQRRGFLTRYIARCEQLLEREFENPVKPGCRGREDGLLAKIEDSKTELFALSKSDDSNPLDSSSAFFRRGGRSDFLRVGPVSTMAEIFGISSQEQIAKAVDDLPTGHNTMGIEDLDESGVDLSAGFKL